MSTDSGTLRGARSRARLACGAGLLAVLCAASGCAQKAPVRSFSDLPQRVRPGHTVYVTDTAGVQVRGRVRDLSPSVLSVEGPDGVAHLPTARIQAIDREGDSLWNGLAIGLGIGTSMALFADPRSVPCPGGRPGVCRDAEIGSRLTAVALFGAIGAGIDALVRRRQPVYVAPDHPPSGGLVIVPAVSGRRAAVVVSLTY